MTKSISKFIEQCQQSSLVAYQQFKDLLKQLDNSATRQQSLLFLRELASYYDKNRPEQCHFQFIEQTVLDKDDNTLVLKLLQFPSTFLPEEWSFTFYEGLVRYPVDQYKSKNIVELGCGIGWISIALALRYPLKQIIGLDINPKAITCARLNLYLNSLNDTAKEIFPEQKTSLLNRVSFYQSDLFLYFENQNIVFDNIIGCIPQVLNPESSNMEITAEETASDEHLQSLSNYSAKQGFIEDQFGLGLIASAVEQAIPLLNTNGKLILNLGGRPGRSIIEQLMQRRGFRVRRVWQTQVEQAADTEINALVDIEKLTNHRFEFYMSPRSDTSISDTSINARTALAYSKSGGKIYHSVDVYEAEMMFPEKVKAIFKSIKQIAKQNSDPKFNNDSTTLSSAIDLTYDQLENAEERYSFLAFFSKLLNNIDYFPYESTGGLNYFRQQLTEYFSYYLSVNIKKKDVLITPGRQELLANLFTNYRPELTLIATSIKHLINKHFDTDRTRILETPAQAEYLIDLINALKPNVVVTKLDSHEIRSSKIIQQLIECTLLNNTLLIIDLTDHFDLSSHPQIHGIYRYLSTTQLPHNLILMAALTNNKVYTNYTLNIALTKNQPIIEHLTDSAELTYSRTPVLIQYYYGHLLEELLFFQRSRSTHDINSDNLCNELPLSLTLSDQVNEAFEHPAIKDNRLQFNSKTVRMDYGENELSTPLLLKETLFESYLIKDPSIDKKELENSFNRFLKRRFNIPLTIQAKVIFGNGVAPIYSALLALCTRNNEILNIPDGSYGYFRSAANYLGLNINVLKTTQKNTFKLASKQLIHDLSDKAGSWLFLNAPVVNPTGAVYSQQQICDILNVAFENRVNVLVDCVFSGLEFDLKTQYDLKKSISQFSQSKDCQLIIIGGISKEYSAGGLRFGYAWSDSSELIESLDNEIIRKPHFTLNYSMNKIINAYLSKDPSLELHLITQAKILKDRAEALANVLESKGWEVILPSGGLFLVAKPKNFIEKHDYTIIEGANLAATQLFKKLNLVINNSTWTGLPGYCRFVLSGDEHDFCEALTRLEKFDLV